MPVQQQMSSFAQKLGGRVAQANAEHAAKPVDTGDRRLPPGIRDGVAKLSTMYTKEYADDKAGLKGQTFFRASAIVVSPVEHKGEKVAGLVTSVMIPLCDVPAKGQRKAKSFSENWYEFQNLFKLLGVPPCPETPQTDPTGVRTEAYFFAAMKGLVDPARMKTNPVFISFSTRGWTPQPSPQQPNPEEMVFETWHGLAPAPGGNGHPDPAAGVQEAPPAPPFNEFAPPPQTQTAPAQGAAPPPTSGPPPQYQPDDDKDPTDEVVALVEVAMGDPEGATEDGAAASARLEELAWKAGWSKEETAGAQDWAAVGGMALNLKQVPAAAPTAPSAAPSANGTPTTGSRWLFAKRTREGERLKNAKGEPFPPQEVEVTAVNAADRTCTVKSVKDGKDVVDIRTKQPVVVKFEWLEHKK